MRIALCTGGGDAPGLNAVIRAAVLSARARGWDVLGLRRGFAGILEQEEVVDLSSERVRGIAHLGGTILRASNRSNPFQFSQAQPGGSTQVIDRSDELIDKLRQIGVDALIAIGGDGTLDIAHRLYRKGVNIVGVPKTIDNDVGGTLATFGFDTAVATAIDAFDKLHTTAESHDRVMVLETMGRHAGFIALHSGVGGTADVILIPEIPYTLPKVCDKIRERDHSGRHFSIVVVAEGAFPIGGAYSVRGQSSPGQAERVGGIAEHLAHDIQKETGKETRSLVLGHLQRGGMPTGHDRLLATRFGAAAVRAVAESRWGEMVSLQASTIATIPIAEAIKAPKRVELDSDLMLSARAMGISFGD